jgi:hypothetical protein
LVTPNAHVVALDTRIGKLISEAEMEDFDAATGRRAWRFYTVP